MTFNKTSSCETRFCFVHFKVVGNRDITKLYVRMYPGYRYEIWYVE
jgi:hypothetical protein